MTGVDVEMQLTGKKRPFSELPLDAVVLDLPDFNVRVRDLEPMAFGQNMESGAITDDMNGFFEDTLELLRDDSDGNVLDQLMSNAQDLASFVGSMDGTAARSETEIQTDGRIDPNSPKYSPKSEITTDPQAPWSKVFSNMNMASFGSRKLLKVTQTRMNQKANLLQTAASDSTTKDDQQKEKKNI